MVNFKYVVLVLGILLMISGAVTASNILDSKEIVTKNTGIKQPACSREGGCSASSPCGGTCGGSCGVSTCGCARR